MQHRDCIALRKISDEISIALDFVGGATLEEFLSNEMMKRAVAMSAINIGELVKNLSMDFRAEHSNIPWKQISGFRDIAAHKYGALDMNYVYGTVTKDFPTLKTPLEKMLNK